MVISTGHPRRKKAAKPAETSKQKILTKRNGILIRVTEVVEN